MNREFDVSKIRNIRGASLTEFRMYSPTVAKVIATFVGDLQADEAAERIQACLNGQAAVIRSSFRWLQKPNSAIGFVTSVPAVRAYDENVVKARYTPITANIFMDEQDKSIWEVKPGSGGQYLSRKSEDNLADLIEASRHSPRGSTPRMASVMSATARNHQFLAFVEPESQSVDYGFCVATEASGYKVLSHTTTSVLDVPRDGIVGVYDLAIPEQILSSINPKAVKAATMDTQTSIEYYKKAYSYAPDYIESIIRQVEQQAMM
jgi:hypothetical protein